MRYCIYCGKQIKDDAPVCDACKRVQPQEGAPTQTQTGARPPSPAQVEAERREQLIIKRRKYEEWLASQGQFPRKYSEKVTYQRKKGKELFVQIFGCAAAFICLIALVLSLTFLPMLSIRKYENARWLKDDLGAFDVIVFAKETVMPSEQNDGRYGNYVESTEEKDLVDRITEKYSKREIDNVFPVIIFSLGYIAALVMTVITAVYFVYSFIGVCSPKYARVPYELRTLRFAAITAGILLVLQLIVPLSLDASYSFSNGAAFFALAAVLVLSLAEALFCILFDGGEVKTDKKRTVKSAICALFCVAVTLFSFTPYAVSGGDVTFFGNENGKARFSMDRSDFFSLSEYKNETEISFNYTEDQSAEEWKSSYLMLKERFNRYTPKDVSRGIADAANENIIVFSLSATGNHRNLELYSVLSVIFAPLCIVCTVLLAEMLGYVYFGEINALRYRIAKISLAVTAVLAYALLFLFVFLAEYAMSKGGADYYILPSVTAVLSFLMAVGAFAVGCGAKKEKAKKEEAPAPRKSDYRYLDN